MEHGPRGAPDLDDWVSQFQRAAAEQVMQELSEEGNVGSLRELVIERTAAGVWAVASFSLDDRPEVILFWRQQVVPDLSDEWEPSFAAMLFGTHLIEWYHTRAKRGFPGSDGTIRN